MLDCRKFEELISGYVDRELDAPEREAVERHLASCRRCALERETLLSLKGRVHYAFAREAVPEGLWEGAAARFGDGNGTLEATPSRRRSPYWSFPRLAPAIGLAAVLLVFAFLYAGKPPGGLTCDEIAGLLPQYVVGEIDLDTALHVNEHMGDCPHCAEYHLQYAHTVLGGQTLYGDTAPMHYLYDWSASPYTPAVPVSAGVWSTDR